MHVAPLILIGSNVDKIPLTITSKNRSANSNLIPAVYQVKFVGESEVSKIV